VKHVGDITCTGSDGHFVLSVSRRSWSWVARVFAVCEGSREAKRFGSAVQYDTVLFTARCRAQQVIAGIEHPLGTTGEKHVELLQDCGWNSPDDVVVAQFEVKSDLEMSGSTESTPRRFSHTRSMTTRLARFAYLPQTERICETWSL
jgi:hypothetical protein